MRFSFTSLLLSQSVVLGTAFAPSTRILFPNTLQSPSAITTPSALNVAAREPIKDISYGEESRKYRRTVYTHDEWVKHRSTERFWRNLRSLVSSGVYKSLFKEVLATTLVAIFVVVWNAALGGYQDLSGVSHEALIKDTILPMVGLPLTPFTLSSPSLALLLVFRTNTSYKRWDEARKNWGMNINHTRDLVRMASTWYDPKFQTNTVPRIQVRQSTTSIPDSNEQAPEGFAGNLLGYQPQSTLPRTTMSYETVQSVRPSVHTLTPEEQEKRLDDLRELSLATWSFVRAMKRHLSPPEEDEDAFIAELYQKLPPKQAAAIIAAAHRPNRALFDLSVAIEKLPMHFLRKNQVHSAVTIFEDNLGSSERLLTSPIPLSYTRHTARFLSSWLLLLPFALYEPFKESWNHIDMIPASAVVSMFLFGIEELAIQLEEPFTILPMQAFCDKIGNWCNEITSWTPGDNGLE